MKNKILLTLIFGMFLISGVFALDSLGTFGQNKNIEISQNCADATYISISSIRFPNSTIAVSNINMTSLGSGEFYYNFTNATEVGRYDMKGISDGCTKEFATYFYVTKTGVESTDSRTASITRSIYFLFIISIVLFIAFLFVKSKPSVKWTFFIISIMFFLQAVTILFTGLQDEGVNPKIEGYFSFLASASFYLFWFAVGILAVLWILTTFQTILFNKQRRKQEKYA